MTLLAEIEVLIPSQPFFRLNEIAEIMGANYHTVHSWTRGDSPILRTIQVRTVHFVTRPDFIRLLMNSERPSPCQ